MKKLIQIAASSLRTQKLTRDIAWSMGSFLILGLSGIVINVTLTALRDAAALGVFNLAYASYIVISQFAVWGIHYSVLRHTALYKEDPSRRTSMLSTAAALSFALGCLSAVLTACAEPLFSRAFDSLETGTALRYASLGLSLFPLNKVLLAYLNGLREMKAYSILQGMRYLTLMAVVACIAASPLPAEQAALGFFVAEVVTTIGGLAFLYHRRLVNTVCFSMEWARTHISFGSRSLLGGTFAEVNSRIDVLLIGLFLSDRATGIYSFAAMMVDGLYHVLAMVRLNFNPVLVAAVRDKDLERARALRAQSGKFVLPVVLTLSCLVVAAYYVLAAWIAPGKGLLEGLPSLLILLGGLSLICVLVPFDNLMVVSGYPGYQAAQQMATVAVNALVATALLPLLGIEGAALGTAASYAAGVLLLVIFARKLLGWQLISNTTLARH